MRILFLQFPPKKSTDVISNAKKEVTYKMYPQRWWVLLTTVGIQIFNFAHFAAFPSVNKVLSKYYHQVIY